MGFFVLQNGDVVDGEGDILSLRELSFALDISRSTLRRWCRQGMPYIRFSNAIGYNLLDIQDWLEQNKQLPPSDLVRRWEQARKTLKKIEGE